jgi:mRNA interferase HicA
MHFVREGARHSVFFNPVLLRKISTVPRHNEIENFLAKKICRDLGIEPAKKKYFLGRQRGDFLVE